MTPLNAHRPRIDPYRAFRFRVTWNGLTVAGVNRVGGLAPATPQSVGGLRTPAFPSITLEEGLTCDAEFMRWAVKTRDLRLASGTASIRDLRKDILIEQYDDAGQVVLTYRVYGCWVSEYEALPDLDADANAVAIQHLRLENEGWERDYSVDEPDP